MFNRSAFNATSFNRYLAAQPGVVSLQGKITATSKAAASMLVKHINAATIAANSSTSADYIRGQEFSGNASALSNTRAKYIRSRRFEAFIAGDSLAYATSLSAYDTEFLRLMWLGLKAGDELYIDTENMTVYINGQNAVNKLTADSSFFELDKSSRVQFEGDGQANLTLLWKDRWL